MKKSKLYLRFKVSGVGSANFPATLFARGITTYDIVYGDGYCLFSANNADAKKIFAISHNMCYNVKRVGFRGKYAPPIAVIRRAGAVVGAICFTVFAYATDGYIEEITLCGDAPSFRQEVLYALGNEGAAKGKFFKNDVSSLGEKLAMSIDGIAYATVEKRGKRLIVEVFKEKAKIEPIDVKREKIVATDDGVVVKINCLSGETVVGVGDSVKRGDTLIEGFYTFKDKRIKTYASGEVALASPYVYEYTAAGKDEIFKARAIALAKERLGECEILSEKCELIERDGKFIFKVTLDRMIIVR